MLLRSLPRPPGLYVRFPLVCGGSGAGFDHGAVAESRVHKVQSQGQFLHITHATGERIHTGDTPDGYVIHIQPDTS